MRSLLIALFLSTIALAGCTGGNGGGPITSADCLEQGLVLGTDENGEPVCVEPPFVIEDFEDPDHYCVVNERRDRLHAPDLVGDPWEIGQSWTYSLDVDGNTSTTQMIYYADQDVGAELPLHYMVGTPTRAEALEQAIHSVNPMIGRVHSVLYSPHESGDHADMFHFPLCEGSSWQTIFYGETFTLTAAKDGSDRRYTITGTSGEGSTLRIDYDADVQWFTLIDLDRADGQTVTMDLQDTDGGATGEAFFLRGQKDFHGEIAAESLLPGVTVAQEMLPFEREDGGAGPYDTIGVHWVGTLSGTGTATLALVAPDGSIVESQEHQLQGESVQIDDMFEVDFQTGEWNVELDLFAASPGGEVTGDIVVDAVSIYDQSCTVGGDCLA